MFIIRKISKYLISKIATLKFLERLSQNKIWRKILEQKKPKIVSSANGKLNHDDWNKLLRYKVWDKVTEYIPFDKDILYLEFGVWQGVSIKYIAKKFTNKNSEFYGFDTFKGMPNKWRFLEKGHYSTSEEFPQTDDKRIKFFKGLFQDTLPVFLNKLSEESKNKIILIHFDCVLHSSTLYTLFKLSEHLDNYYFLFDELGTDECRAFNSFNDAKNKDYDLYLASKFNGAPEVVFGKFKN
tara:strand:+ start:416 stop:1132 length:717 start_codon:yes stop_codon:yes gene_type:complete